MQEVIIIKKCEPLIPGSMKKRGVYHQGVRECGVKRVVHYK